MITSREDYLRYLEADRIALCRTKSLLRLWFDDVWKFQRLMRQLEYLVNCKKSRLLRLVTHYRYRKLGIKLGFSISINTFGPGLSIAHYGTIVVNGGARVGANCRLHVGVVIGTEAGKRSDAPTIGDNCYIGPGAKLFGKIRIGHNVAIGANAVVTKSFEEGTVTLAGVPARVISSKGSIGL
ncbi:serine O-acetyltransferase [Massilia aerilata]|uniref:Serine O-acetyltransferase n=1 Tax=Massilia aerilata TaxID=453817 RepID=A0ABW0S326_9BURK